MIPPTFGPTGSPVTDYSIESREDSNMHFYLKPTHPSREVDVYDADGDFVELHTLSDEAWAERLVVYENAVNEWKATHGRFAVRGPMHYSCKVQCQDSTTGEGIWAEERARWEWTSISFRFEGR